MLRLADVPLVWARSTRRLSVRAAQFTCAFRSWSWMPRVARSSPCPNGH